MIEKRFRIVKSVMSWFFGINPSSSIADGFWLVCCYEMETTEKTRLAGDPHRRENTFLLGSFLP